MSSVAAERILLAPRILTRLQFGSILPAKMRAKSGDDVTAFRFSRCSVEYRFAKDDLSAPACQMHEK